MQKSLDFGTESKTPILNIPMIVILSINMTKFFRKITKIIFSGTKELMKNSGGSGRVLFGKKRKSRKRR